MNEHLRQAMEALERGARDTRSLSARSAGALRDRLRQTAEEVLDHLEAEENEDVVSKLDRQSKDIAEDLRRAERLMKQRLGRE